MPQISAKIPEVIKVLAAATKLGPLGIAEHIPSTKPDLTKSLGEYGSSGLGESVGDARPPEIAKFDATAAVTTVVKPVDVGEARPPGTAKHSATKSADEARPLGIANYSATTAVAKSADEARDCEVQCHDRSRKVRR